MRVLLICDDHWHPGQVPIDGTALLLQHGFQFDIITNANDFSPEVLTGYPVVLLCKCDEVSSSDRSAWKTQAVQRAFINYVEGGGGLLIVHSGTVAGQDTAELDRLIGCRFVSHPDVCPVTVQPVKPHPVTRGVELFCEPDEQYKLDILSPDIDILLASYSPEAICPAGYVRTQGKGRICVLTPGHTLAVWQNPQFQLLLANALEWGTGD